MALSMKDIHPEDLPGEQNCKLVWVAICFARETVPDKLYIRYALG